MRFIVVPKDILSLIFRSTNNISFDGQTTAENYTHESINITRQICLEINAVT